MTVQANERDPLIDDVLRYLGHEDRVEAVAALNSTLSERRSPRTVAVIGEVNRGKSMLVNALVGMRGTCPVNHERTTSEPQRVTVLAEAVGAIATVDDVTTVVTDLLPPVSLVDCPGFNGADGVVLDSALNLVGDAGTIVVVLDALGTITEGELDVVAQAVQQCGSVIVVVVKRDKNLIGWREIVDEDSRLLQDKIGVDLPVLGVSSLRALAARDSLYDGDADVADGIESDSGIRELRTAIAASVTGPDAGTRERVLRHARILMREEAASQARLAVDDGDDLRENVRIAETALAEAKGDARRDRQLLSGRISNARISALSAFDELLADAQSRWDEYFESTPARKVAAARDAVLSGIRADLSAAVERAFVELLGEIREAYLELSKGVGDWDAIVATVRAEPRLVDVDGPKESGRIRDLVDPGLVTITVAGGFSLTQAVTMLPGVGGALALTGGLGALPFAAVAGVWFGVNVFHRAAKRGGRELRKWFHEVVARLRRQMTQDIDRVLNQLQPVVLNQFHDDAERRQNELAGVVKQAKIALRAGAPEAEDAARRAARKRDWIDGILAEIDDELVDPR